MALNIAVEIPRPMVTQSLVTVLKIPPAMDCCLGGRDDITYMLATLNSRSAPITVRQRDGKVMAQ